MIGSNVHSLPNAGTCPVGSPPEGMPDVQAQKWHDSVLQFGRVLTEMDRDALTIYCETWAEMQNAKRRVDEDGAMVLLPSGVVQKSPWLSKLEHSREFCRKMAASWAGRERRGGGLKGLKI